MPVGNRREVECPVKTVHTPAIRGFMDGLAGWPIADPCRPMPPVASWYESYGGVSMDAATFDECERDWYRLLDERRRRTSRYLDGYAVGTVLRGVSAAVALIMVGLLCLMRDA